VVRALYFLTASSLTYDGLPDTLGRPFCYPADVGGLPAASDLTGEGDGPGAEVEGGSDWGLHIGAPHVHTTESARRTFPRSRT